VVTENLPEKALFKINTPAREAEVCGLRSDSKVDIPQLGARLFVVPGSYVKNWEEQLVVLNETAKAIVEARRGRDPVNVYVQKGKHVAKMNSTGCRSARREAAGL
jgi:hypothetical protein